MVNHVSSFMTPLLYYAVPATSDFLHNLFIVIYNITSVQSFNSSHICAVFTPRHKLIEGLSTELREQKRYNLGEEPIA